MRSSFVDRRSGLSANREIVVVDAIDDLIVGEYLLVFKIERFSLPSSEIGQMEKRDCFRRWNNDGDGQ